MQLQPLSSGASPAAWHRYRWDFHPLRRCCISLDIYPLWRQVAPVTLVIEQGLAADREAVGDDFTDKDRMITAGKGVA